MERKETVDGFEAVFALNHLAYYSLTNLLLENFATPNNLKLPIARNILEKYYS